jgi:hypothetical protein
MEAALRAAEVLKSFRVSRLRLIPNRLMWLHFNERPSRVQFVSERIAELSCCAVMWYRWTLDAHKITPFISLK